MSKHVHAFGDDALGTMDATAIADAIKSKRLSVKEVVVATITRAEKVNPQLNAITLKLYENAENYHYLNRDSFFYGVPTFVKDNDDIKGYPTQHGTGVFIAKPAKKNSSFVNQMIFTGLNLIGKSTTPEFSLNCSTENEKWGITRNPWNTAYTPGGSSSGSGAMVASGVTAIAQANDGAGSTRIPAALCGLIGLKPSRERLVNHTGTHLLPINVVHEGVLTRSVRDTAAFYAEAEKYYKSSKLPSIGHVKDPIKKRLKVAFLNNRPEGEVGHVDADTFRVNMETATLLESLGHHVEQIDFNIDLEEMMNLYLIYYGFLAFVQSDIGSVVYQSKIDTKNLEPFTYGLANIFKRNILNFPKSIFALKSKIAKLESDLFSRYDVLMLPVTSIQTPKIGYLSPLLSSKEIVRRSSTFAPFPGMQNVSGSPSISLPVGTDSNGLPLGLQFSAPLGQDGLLLALAYEIEAAQPWKKIYTS